jgi:parallel beta-helix repeat protein
VAVGVLALLTAALVAQAPLPPPLRGELPLVTPRRGMVITRSMRIAPGTYKWAGGRGADSSTVGAPLLIIRGRNITVDLRGVTFEGTPPDSAPDAARGTALFIDGGEQITVRGMTARGYRFGILAKRVRALTLIDNDLSYGWKPRLFSVVEHESLADWLSFHQNEKEEWQRFGAGVYLDQVTGGVLRGNTVRQSMNGLLLTRTDSLQIRENDLSFNSGLGIGMYRSSWNTMVYNRADYNVRGSSTGFYQRGQDSAALLMFEQCSHNVVAYNSMTHSGDGLFLWAGQHTMDTGDGGANDNLFLMNDFSFAPTNGMEATFSRNSFIGNRVEGSTHGLWGGYSFSSRIIGNCFANNRIAIAIEHGQDNLIGGNHFAGDTLGIRLWADSRAPSDWGYPKHRDTRSRDWRMVENRFARVPEPWRLSNTHIADSSRNVRSDTSDVCEPSRNVPTTTWWRIPSIEREPRAWPRTAVAEKPRDAIVVDEWGPYDWQSPKLWPIDSTRSGTVRLRVLGPPGRWQLRSLRGVQAMSSRTGQMGDTIAVTPDAEHHGDWRVALVYRGVATRTPRGVRRIAGAPVSFDFEHFAPIQSWTQQIRGYSETLNPFAQPEAFAKWMRETPPLMTRTEPRLDWLWSRPRDAAVPATRFVMDAESRVALAPGRYTLRTISDDAVRVWVDDTLVIDHFTPHESAPAYAALDGGVHRLRVQYIQVAGWVELRLDILRGAARPSPGSAGPH